MLPTRTPHLIQACWPHRLWRMPANPSQPCLYLTFDDGPTPGVTDWVLDQLDTYQAKATFFVVGQLAKHHPSLPREALERGHAVGTHTQNHLNGWKTHPAVYLRDVQAGNESVTEILKRTFPDYQPLLFRPPYGRLLSCVARKITVQRIVMWHVLASDWRDALNAEQVSAKVINNAQNGSIVVFHDSLKAEPRIKGALPRVLEYFAKRGYRFENLE